MCRLDALLVACALAGAGVAGLAAVRAHATAPAVAQPPVPSFAADASATTALRSPTVTATPWPTIEPGACMGYGTKVASERAFIGDTIGITLTVRALCAGSRFPVHVVFVMDGSEAMTGRPNREMREAASDLIRGIDLENHPSAQFAVVEFRDSARRLCPLTNDEVHLRGCIQRVSARGATSIEAGLREAQRVLRSARQGISRYERVTDVVVLFSQGCDEDGCRRSLGTARDLKGEGVLVASVCVGGDCASSCMLPLASSQRYFFRASNVKPPADLFHQILNRILNINVRRVTVTDLLPPTMRYVPGSARPAPTMINAGADELVWEDVYMPKEGVTYTFEVEPLELGAHPTNLEARAELLASTGWQGGFVYEVPTVVVETRPTATMDLVAPSTPAPSHTATARPTNTPGHVASPTLTPSGGASPVPSPSVSVIPAVPQHRAWLPAAVRFD